MTCRAILEDGQLHIPVQRVLAGELSLRQVDSTYHGAIGLCPDCEALHQDINLSDRRSLALAIATSSRSVSYRRGCYSGLEIRRQMHFAHQRGYRSQYPAACRNLRDSLHREVVETIANHYRQALGSQFLVQAGCQFVRPGTPPETYRPDITVTHLSGSPYLCIEYQRSYEDLQHFIQCHSVRTQQWGKVIWFFEREIYSSQQTKLARDWLSERCQEFYVCWIDGQTGRLQAEAGKPSTLRQEKRVSPILERPCPLADGRSGRISSTPPLILPAAAPDVNGGISFTESYSRTPTEREAVSALPLSRKATMPRSEEEEMLMRSTLLDEIQTHYSRVAVLGDLALSELIDPQTGDVDEWFAAGWSFEELQAEAAWLRSLYDIADEVQQQGHEQQELREMLMRSTLLDEIQTHYSRVAVLGDLALSELIDPQTGDVDEWFAAGWSFEELQAESTWLKSLYDIADEVQQQR